MNTHSFHNELLLLLLSCGTHHEIRRSHSWDIPTAGTFDESFSGCSPLRAPLHVWCDFLNVFTLTRFNHKGALYNTKPSAAQRVNWATTDQRVVQRRAGNGPWSSSVSLTGRTRLSYQCEHDRECRRRWGEKGRAEEITESITATLCRELGDEGFHTAVCGVTSCHLLFKQSVAAAGLLGRWRCLARQHVSVMYLSFLRGK